MNEYPLPPKRFEQIDDPKYDAIRGKPWFHKLETRREKIPILKACYEATANDPNPDARAAGEFGVDPRELRDYTDFVEGRSKLSELTGQQRRTYQHILNVAYDSYTRFRAASHIRTYIEMISPQYGLESRPIVEIWEIDPSFYPERYTK